MSEITNTTYVHVAKATTEEMVEMYRKLRKDVLIGMLIECNRQLDLLADKTPVYGTFDICNCYNKQGVWNGSRYICQWCKKAVR